ncbi:MAG: CO dehydrogenase/CO-methylating acetyl-CoA synthase complex subunit beta [Actinobacteria bacterium]|nr:CO dehydrogenase/CO-methylating acetyl-CoA synthase complex subunit beta [Actinomycetota bacterium]MBL7124084.1 CO dehydrogenase/CO-methylating acetyl-CoA synthase complex subunit beta [Actinomycetota bacterium]
MSKIIITGAIKGAYKIVERAEKSLKDSLKKHGPDQKLEFPNTGYFLPVIYSMTGIKVEKLSDAEKVMEEAKKLLPPVPSKKVWLPYLGWGLDAGIATLWAEEIIEAIKYVDGPNPVDGIWLGAADDVILRERGIEFVDGTAPGFAACVGACKDNKTAVKIARELQEKNIYVFMSASTDGKSMAEQLAEEGVELGWDTRLVSYGKDITSTVYAAGFAARAALSFGGVQGGEYRKMLYYNKNRIFAFVLALGKVDDEKYANAAGAINFGFPTIANTDIPEILPRGVCTYEHVVSNISDDEIVTKAIEVRGLKITIDKVDVPVAFGAAFEGERVRKENMYVEFGGNKSEAVEFLHMAEASEVEDGKVEVFGPEIDDVKEGSAIPLGIEAIVTGRKMQSDFEPVMERQIHYFTNYASGIFHMGQRDIVWMRFSKDAVRSGFKIKHLGTVLHAKMHTNFGNIMDKIQIKIYTNLEDVVELKKRAKEVFKVRDERLSALTDESVDTYYSCTLCQSFAPNHICAVSPERPGLCGAYNWLDCKAAYEISPTGPNQPIKKGETLDEKLGVWKGVNDFVYKSSNQTLESFSAYSMMENPMTSCGCFEVIITILPSTNGIMAVNREHVVETPCGMKFSTIAGMVGGGIQTPGFIGISKFFIASKKFISADGGLKRLVWMPKELKEEIKDHLKERAEEMGIPDFIDKIATDEDAQTEEQVLEWIQKVKHPVLEMEPMM